MKKFLSILFSIILILQVGVHARGPAQKQSTPVFEDSGSRRDHYRLAVNDGSGQPQPFSPPANITWDAYGARKVTVQNPNTFDVVFASWSEFDTRRDGYGIIPKSSGSIELGSMTTSYFKAPTAANVTGYILITVERDATQ